MVKKIEEILIDTHICQCWINQRRFFKSKNKISTTEHMLGAKLVPYVALSLK